MKKKLSSLVEILKDWVNPQCPFERCESYGDKEVCYAFDYPYCEHYKNGTRRNNKVVGGIADVREQSTRT